MGNTTHPVVDGNIQALAQLHGFVCSLTGEQYGAETPLLTRSAIGAHCRHILDMYEALFQASDAGGVVDYDFRRRGAGIEHDQTLALANIERLQAWLECIPAGCLDNVITVRSEVDLTQQVSTLVESNIARELMFAASHCIHHLALMGMLAAAMGLRVESELGVAPATASFLRSGSELAEIG